MCCPSWPNGSLRLSGQRGFTYIWHSLARLVQVSGPDGLPHKPWDLDESRRFLQAAKGDRLEALWSVAVALGLRRGEIGGLR
jgi:integrase